MKNTNWSTATENPIEVVASLIHALKTGKNAWIEIQKNGEQSFPINVKNPELDNPFNWTMSYGVPSRPNADENFFNDTQKDLTLNWAAEYGERGAIEEYQMYGKLSPDLLRGQGICHPMRKSDVLKLRGDLRKEKWTTEDFWTTHWTPKQGIPYWIPADIDKVYVVCVDDEPQSKQTAIESAIVLLQSLIPQITEKQV